MMATKSNTIKLFAIAALLTFVSVIAVCKSTSLQTVLSPEVAELKQETWANEPILPIPTDISLDARKVALGEKLFNDPQLSHDNTISCSTCHSLSLGGTDQMARPSGIQGQLGAVNAPTVFNATYNFKQFWDGRAETLEAQIDGPSLRNVSQTYPYFHDSSAKSLNDAVTVMSKYQLGREPSPLEIDSIVKFLGTLDGEYKRYTP